MLSHSSDLLHEAVSFLSWIINIMCFLICLFPLDIASVEVLIFSLLVCGLAFGKYNNLILKLWFFFFPFVEKYFKGLVPTECAVIVHFVRVSLKFYLNSCHAGCKDQVCSVNFSFSKIYLSMFKHYKALISIVISLVQWLSILGIFPVFCQYNYSETFLRYKSWDINYK